MGTVLQFDKQATTVQKLREYEGAVRLASWLGKRLSVSIERGRLNINTERIVWFDASKSSPEDDRTVLISFPVDGTDETDPVSEGYFSAGEWFSTEGWPLGDRVRGWAYKPKGMR